MHSSLSTLYEVSEAKCNFISNLISVVQFNALNTPAQFIYNNSDKHVNVMYSDVKIAFNELIFNMAVN